MIDTFPSFEVGLGIQIVTEPVIDRALSFGSRAVVIDRISISSSSHFTVIPAGL